MIVFINIFLLILSCLTLSFAVKQLYDAVKEEKTREYQLMWLIATFMTAFFFVFNILVMYNKNMIAV